MAAVTLDIPPAANERGSCECRYVLEGREYVVVWQWNQRQQRWSMSLYDSSRVPIVTGIALRAEWPLLDLVTDDRRPPGEFRVWDSTGAGQDPGLDELGSRALVLYYPAA